MKFNLSNKFYLCYYGQVNSVQLKSSVATKWGSKHLLGVTIILQAMVPTILHFGNANLIVQIVELWSHGSKFLHPKYV